MSTLVIRTAIMFIVVSVSVRIMGKRTIGELQASELVIVLIISDIAAIPMQSMEVPLISGIIPVALLTAFEVITSVLIMKSPVFGRLVCGRPMLVINKGVVDQKAMKELRLTCEDLFEGLRKSGVFDIETVEYALMETDGTLSVLKRSTCEPPTSEDMKIDVGETVLRALVVSDGTIDENSMRIIGWDRNKIENIVKINGLKIEDVFILTGCRNGNYNIILKERTK